MTDIMRVLYTYAEEHMVRGLMGQEKGYGEACQRAGKQEEALYALVGEERVEELEELLNGRDEVTFYHDAAVFAAGFKIGLELTR